MRFRADIGTAFVFIVVLVFFISNNSGEACSVPVFRYALERWPADIYRAVIFHDQPIDSATFSVLRNSNLNLEMQMIDVTSNPGKAWAEQFGLTSFPRIMLHYPENTNVSGIVWEGEFTKESVTALCSSPARSALVEKLLAADAAVWVLIKSGDAKLDDQAEETLKKSLNKASKNLRIPETATDVDGNPIKVDDFQNFELLFRSIQISRNDPVEKVFVQTLLGTEPDLYDVNGPILFPVFGRGRALYALVGKGIREEIIIDACKSIIAWCSCEIKDQNPGTDLLLAADWSNPKGGALVIEEVPEITGFDSFLEEDAQQESKPVSLTNTPLEKEIAPDSIESTQESLENQSPVNISIIDPVEENTISFEHPPAISGIYRNILVLLAIVFAAIAAGTLIAKKKKK